MPHRLTRAALACQHEEARPRTNAPTVLCRFLGSMPVCKTASAEIAKVANSDSGHCHPFPLSSNQIHISGCSSDTTRRQRQQYYLNQSQSLPFFPTNSHPPAETKRKQSYRCDRQTSPGPASTQWPRQQQTLQLETVGHSGHRLTSTHARTRREGFWKQSVRVSHLHGNIEAHA